MVVLSTWDSQMMVKINLDNEVKNTKKVHGAIIYKVYNRTSEQGFNYSGTFENKQTCVAMQVLKLTP